MSDPQDKRTERVRVLIAILRNASKMYGLICASKGCDEMDMGDTFLQNIEEMVTDSICELISGEAA